MDTKISSRVNKIVFAFGEGKLMLNGYTDADLSEDVDSRKSIFRYLTTFVGGVIF